MRERVMGGTFLVLALTASAVPANQKAGRPVLDLRASPRVAFSPANVLVTAELKGGREDERYYCPEVEFDWDDGARSARESDCPPLADGAFERRFTANHAYRQAGVYNVKVTMRRASRTLAVATTTVTVRGGLGDPGLED